MGWKSFVVALWEPLMGAIAAAAWPGGILIAAWLARPLLIRLSEALAQLIATRDFRLKVGGVEASMAAIPQQAAAEDLPAPEVETNEGETRTLSTSPKIPVPSERPLVNAYILDLQQALSGYEEDSKLPTLIRWYADLRTTAVHEFIFNRIFGSQVALLNRMNQAGGALTRNEVQAHVEDSAKAHGVATNANMLETYLRFLLSYTLVTWSDDRLVLTNQGKDFLVYIVTASLNPASRPL